MKLPWVWAGLLGLLGFVAGLAAAAWQGQDSDGRWRPGAWRWLVLAAAGFGLLVTGLRLAGAEQWGFSYPR
jgi:hypothetical protein